MTGQVVAGFGDRLAEAMDVCGPLCVGIDPHPELLARWGLADDPAGLREFALGAVAALAGHVAAVKPQSAFFERHGSAGVAVLEETLAAAREAGVLTILDAKRGDIGSTMTAYAEAYLGAAGTLAADALTISPYLGIDSVEPAVRAALAHGRGVFVLALTSNPGGPGIQHARGPDGRTVADAVVDAAVAANTGTGARLGPVGLVIGATVGSAVRDLGLDLVAARAPVLAPGLGAQGATASDLTAVFGDARRQVLASASRSVLRAGPDADQLRSAAAHLVEELRQAGAT